ncbi:MAG: DUF5060 domain-containing protein [Anaerolineae bacterium]|jgi:hypothetical protein|nr:DUF5060 domain-containing protein [Anaerolineae bacterium]
MIKRLLIFIGLIAIVSIAHAQPTMTITPQAESVGQYEKFELVITHDIAYDNPYDPDDIRLDAEFEAPNGAILRTAGFFYRDYLQAETNPDILIAQAESWRVRFAPTQIGTWRYRVIITTPNTTATSDWARFEVSPSDNKGFIRIDERNRRYFAFDNGDSYFPVGQNMGWAVENPIANYQTWLDEMNAVGANFIRVWMASWGFGIEWTDTGLGNYDNRQDRAFQLDKVIELAEARDIYIMLALLNHGAFSETVNAEWDNNPYNRANGGMLDSPVEFGTHPDARRLWLQRLRYIVARWGYSTSIMSWEWWNEVNWTPLADETILSAWMADGNAYLAEYDPYDHLITHSGSQVNHASVWTDLDFTQQHLYEMRNLPREFASEIPQWLTQYPDKPFLMGEFGSPADVDTDGLLIHLGLWSAPMNGASGTGMTWWWDTYIHPNNLYYHFGGVASFFADEDMGAYSWQPTSATLSDDGDAKVYGLQTENRALLWVVSDDYSPSFMDRQYRTNLRNNIENPLAITFPVLSGLSITLPHLTDGEYVVEIWDTFTGEIIRSDTVRIGADGATIALPDFDRDLAVKVK